MVVLPSKVLVPLKVHMPASDFVKLEDVVPLTSGPLIVPQLPVFEPLRLNWEAFEIVTVPLRFSGAEPLL